MERCEREIKGVINSYANSIPDLIELGQEFPGIQKYIPEHLMQQIQQYVGFQQNEIKGYYSFDGLKHSSIEEAMARNQALLEMVEKPQSR